MFSYSITHDYFIRSNKGPSSYLPEPIPSPTLKTDIVVTVFPRWLKHVAVQWSIPASWGECLFNVYFSQTEDGHFEKLNSMPINGTYLIDDDTQEYRKFNNGYYIVEALPQDDTLNIGIVRSKPVTWSTVRTNFVEIRAREINRREHFLLSKFVGVKTYVFKRKTYGKRCHECWDHVGERITKDHCQTCLGTSFEGGYFAPVPCYFQYEADTNAERRTYTGIEEPSDLTGWTIAFPQIHPDDVVVRTGDWKVCRVDAISHTELQAKTVRQILKMTEVGRGAIEHQLITKNLPEFPEEYR